MLGAHTLTGPAAVCGVAHHSTRCQVCVGVVYMITKGLVHGARCVCVLVVGVLSLTAGNA